MSLQYLTPEDYERAEKNGISARLLYQRYFIRAWDKEKAITKPHKMRTYNPEYIELAKKNGIPYGTFRVRMASGYTQLEAATRPLNTRHDEFVRIAKQNGIEYNTYQQRVHRGWDKMEAATRPLGYKKKKTA